MVITTEQIAKLLECYFRIGQKVNGVWHYCIPESFTDCHEEYIMCFLRHRIAFVFTIVVVLVLILNYFIQYTKVFSNEYGNFKRRDPSNPMDLTLSDYGKVDVLDLVIEHNISYNKPINCHVIHIGLVCAGFSSNMYLHTMLKSLYFYRNNPLHFHILVNKMSENVLYTLFQTWAVPQVNVSFYDINDFIYDVRWVPNNHYSGVYGLLKLVFPKVIPHHVEKIIILDTDLTFNADISDLWQLFDGFNNKQAVGLVENQSDYYLSKKTLRWPAVGRGFNTGVILYHLERLRLSGWNGLWNKIGKQTAIIYGTTSLADQDIINAVIKENPDLVYEVPCYWNTQLSYNTLSYNCYKNNHVKVVHWNSPKKFNVVNKDGIYFRSMYTTFLELNGNLLRRQLYDCSSELKSDEEVGADVCSDFHKAQTNKWRTLLYFRKFVYNPVNNDVTFVAQFSYDRLQLIEDLCRHWDGPMSLTLYATDPEFQQSNMFLDNIDVLKDRTNIAFHIVFKDGEYHPINILRNVGLRNVNTPYVFLADIDFLPMFGLYKMLKNHLAAMKSMDKKALIVTAFETQRYRSRFPKSKTELLQMLESKSVFTFRYDVWASGHAPTNYTKWKTAKVPYKVKWEPDFEPYVVVRADVVEYDVRFMGFGWNKVSHIMELEAQGYEFIVLPNTFIVHKPHSPSYDIAKFRKSPIYRMCLQNLKEKFVSMLQKKYGRIYDQKNSSILSSK